MTPGRRLALRIVSRYAGVRAARVAEVERISEVTVRACRQSLGRGGELGHTPEDTLRGAAPADDGPLQLSLGGIEDLMRSNRSVCG
jgi:hypothetical protein